MSVSSLELSKKLYELSGWTDTDFIYYANGGIINDNVEYRPMVFDKPDHLPAYDSGYLLRKLPPELKLDGLHYVGDSKVNDFYLEMEAPSGDSDKWIFFYSNGGESEFYGKGMLAYTPEDALCKLAIQLFEQGILERSIDK